jgi:hypothetical protein
MVVLAPTATGQQAILAIPFGTGVQDLNALWGGVRDRWRDFNAYVSIVCEGGVGVVRFIFPGEVGGVTASNGITIPDGGRRDYLVPPSAARLDYTTTAGFLKLHKSSASA